MTANAPRLVPPRLVERVLAPGADAAMTAMLRSWIAERAWPRRLLDVGVGTQSLLAAIGTAPVGVDHAAGRVRIFAARGGHGVVGTAIALPFSGGAFDAVLCAGLLHHLTDADARATLAEMLRVAGSRGRVAVFDSVLPEPAWRRPLAWTIRRADRGRHVRRAVAVQALLPEPTRWQTTRMTYAHTGLEGLWCTRG